MIQRIFSYVVLLSLGLCLGCANLSSNTSNSKDDSTDPIVSTVPLLEPPEATPVMRVAIEVVWEIPSEAVDEYVLRYGVSPSKLDQETRVKVASLTTLTDSRFGKVYHYLISDAPADKRVYVSVSAIKDGIESEPSRVFEVAPKT